MRHHQSLREQSPWTKRALLFVCCVLIAVPAQPCTIFVLTDTNRVLFCNNEDWLNPKTRIWFVPAEARRYGCVYVGFDDGFAQGGLNTAGLACDWVAGSKEPWNPDPNLPTSVGNRQLLETCGTVEEAVAYFQGHRELGFYTSRILVADRTGASAIIGAKEGKLQVEKSNQCRGFGYGAMTLKNMLSLRSSEASVANGAEILRACLQKGKYATKYSNIFRADALKSPGKPLGKIFLVLLDKLYRWSGCTRIQKTIQPKKPSWLRRV